MAITNLAGRYLQDSFKFVTQNSQSAVSPDKWIFADGEAVPITWIDVTASWAATASVALALVDNIWVRSSGSNSAVLNDSSSRISVAYGTSSIAYGNRTTASGDFSQAQGSSSVSLGTASFAGGLHTIASASFQTVFGRYNKQSNTDDYFVVGDGTMDIPISRSNALGVNASRFYASNSIFFPDLVSQSYQHVVVFNTASGQINYVTASTFGGGGGTTLPGGPTGSIQFNSASTFSGSSYLTYNFQNSQLILTGSQVLQLSGSSTALQIINECNGQVAQLANLPFLPYNSFRLRPLIYVPSSSSDPNIKGQLWFIHEDNDGRPKPTQIFEVTSSNGDLRFKGYIGSSSGTPPTPQGNNGRLRPPAIHAANFPGRGRVLVGNRYSNGLVAYDPDKVAVQPDGFTYNYPSAQDTALYEYISPLTGSNGNGLAQGRYTATVNNIKYTPSASVGYYSVFNVAVSKSNAGYNTDTSLNPLLAGTYLSKSINDLYNAGLDLSGSAEYWPLGFFMSTFDGTVATNTQYVDLTTQLLALGLEKRRIFSGSITVDGLGRRSVGPGLPYNYGSFTVAGEYNPDLNRIYVAVNFGGGLHPYVGYVEVDNDTSPPTVLGYVTSSLLGLYHAGITYNSTTKDLLIRDNFNTTYKIYDANGTINWNTPKATITMPTDFVGGQLTGFQLGTPIASGNDFYLAGGKPAPAGGQNLFSIIFESQSTGYVVKTGSLVENWEYTAASPSAVWSLTNIEFGSNINKFFVGNNSSIGPVGNPDTVDESSIQRAKSNNIYSFTPVAGSPTTFNTPSQIVFNPYTYDVDRIGNFVEFVDCTGEVLSYVDANGVFQGTASFASNVLPGGSSIEFYSGSVLQTSNLEGLVISGSYLQSQANGNQVTMSIDLSSILATFTSQSFTTPSTTWLFDHNLNERHPLITVYDNNHEVIIPQDVVGTTNNRVTITFSSNTTGYAVAGAGPFTGLTRYPISFYSASVLQTADLRSLAITGSGVTSTLNGNQITMSFTGGGGGSANPGGSNTTIQFNYNGNALSGSNNFTFISQSNTALLTGSLIVSNSLTTIGTNTITGSLVISGSTRHTGSIFVSGAISASFAPNTVGFVGTSSWAVSASWAPIGPGTPNTLAKFDSTGVNVENTTIAYNPSGIAPGNNNIYYVQDNGLLIGDLNSSKLSEYSGSNIYVNNIHPTSQFITASSGQTAIVKSVDLTVPNLYCYGMQIDYNIVYGDSDDFGYPDRHEYDDNIAGRSLIPYSETGTIYFTWNGGSSDPYSTPKDYLCNGTVAISPDFALFGASTFGGLPAGTEPIDASVVYIFAPRDAVYHDQSRGHQFGYRVVNDLSSTWFAEVVLHCDNSNTAGPVNMTYTTKLLTYKKVS